MDSLGYMERPCLKKAKQKHKKKKKSKKEERRRKRGGRLRRPYVTKCLPHKQGSHLQTLGT